MAGKKGFKALSITFNALTTMVTSSFAVFAWADVFNNGVSDAQHAAVLGMFSFVGVYSLISFLHKFDTDYKDGMRTKRMNMPGILWNGAGVVSISSLAFILHAISMDKEIAESLAGEDAQGIFGVFAALVGLNALSRGIDMGRKIFIPKQASFL